MIKAIVSFVILGMFFAFVYDVVTKLEQRLKNRYLAFAIDFFMMIIFALVFFCVLLGYANAEFRIYYALAIIGGIIVYAFVFHKLFLSKNR